MKIRDFELVVRVAEAGSMSLAAQQLNLTPAAVSAAIRRIEEALGVRLFERTTRSLHPTDEGLVLLEGCQAIVERWQRALDDLRGERAEVRGTVLLSAPVDTTYQILGGVIEELAREHPGLRVVVQASDVVRPLLRDAIDMAIRYGRLEDSSLSARKLVACPAVLVASPSYLAEHGTPTRPADLSGHRCLTLQLSSVPIFSWTLRGAGRTQTVQLESALCGDGYLCRRWAVAGMGIALKSLFDVIDDLEDGRLERVLPDYMGDQIPIHAVFPSHRFLPGRVRALDRAIARAFAERAARCRAAENAYI